MRRVPPVAAREAPDPPLIQRNTVSPNAAMVSISIRHRSITMMDIFMSALALAFFAAAIGYTYACERL